MQAEGVGAIALDLVVRLESAQIPCAIGDALALATWGAPRATTDVDLNAFVGPDDYERVLAVLEAGGCQLDRAKCLAQAKGGEVMVAHRDGYRVDVFVPSIPFDWISRDRVRRVGHDSGTVPFLSPEALAVYKLLFFRPKDLVDLANLVSAMRGTLDHAWVRAQMVDMLGEDSDRVVEWDKIVRTHGPR